MVIDRVDDESITASDPPDQASPKHILNVLNNDCIQEILCRLKNIKDFLSAAEVCTRFQENARQCFPPIYKVFYSTHAEDLGSKSHLVLPLNRVQSFLSIFGDFIVKIAWGHQMELFNQIRSFRNEEQYSKKDTKENYFYGVNNLRLLAEYCGKTVKELQIRNRIIDLRMLYRFPALECLEIYDCMSVYDDKTARPELFPKLRSLKIAGLYSPTFDWLERMFPKLIEAEFTYIDILQQNTLIEFLKRNPQLQRLYVDTIFIYSSFWHAFDNISPSSLRYLHIEVTSMQSKYVREIKYLGKYFSNLKYIYLSSMMDSAVSSGFINLLVENNVPIEILSLKWRGSICADAIQKFKHIKEVRVRGRDRTYEGEILEICKSLPNLKWLKIYTATIYGMDIIEALKYSKNGILSIYLWHETTINSNLYYELLNLCENRVKLQIFGHKITILVENSVLGMNKGWLQIEVITYNSYINSQKELPDLRFGKFCQLGMDPRCNGFVSRSLAAKNIPGFNIE